MSKFYIQFKEPYFKKGDILEAGSGYKLKVLRRYRNTLWRRFLRRLGFKVKSFNGVYVKDI